MCDWRIAREDLAAPRRNEMRRDAMTTRQRQHDWRTEREDMAAERGLIADQIVCATCGEQGRKLFATLDTPAEARDAGGLPGGRCEGQPECTCGDGRPQHWQHERWCALADVQAARRLPSA